MTKTNKKLKYTENINKLIIEFITFYYRKHIDDINFNMYTSRFCVGSNFGLLFHMSKKNDKYKIKLKLIENVGLNRNRIPCSHCGNKKCGRSKCRFRYKCCYRNFSLRCALRNDFQCGCKKRKQMYLNQTNQTNECCVCFEETNLKTNCNHDICLSCLDKLVKTKNLKNNCPMCRTYLFKRKNCKYNIKIKIDDNYLDCLFDYYE